MAFAGGFAREDHIFKALALGSPYVKAVCIGRALMIPAFLGSNVEGVLRPERKEEVNGNWNSLPKTIKEMGEAPPNIFSGWFDVEDKIGEDQMENIPFGAVAMWNYVDKLKAGLKQLMAGARKFKLNAINRGDLMSANKETKQITGIPHMVEAYDDEAKQILSE